LREGKGRGDRALTFCISGGGRLGDAQPDSLAAAMVLYQLEEEEMLVGLGWTQRLSGPAALLQIKIGKESGLPLRTGPK
jgi:hypothetical protein